MKSSQVLVPLAVALTFAAAPAVRAGAPAPDTRAADFEHVCKGGNNKDLACTVANEATDCPKSTCVPKTLSKTIKGKLTLISHDSVTDWLNGLPPPPTTKALTVMLEVKAPDGSKQILAATYQDLAVPTDPPQAPSNVVSLPIDEAAVQALASAVGGLVFAQPESTIALQLQTLFSVAGTPVIIEVKDKTVQSADHTGDNLAAVLRFKVKIQFVDPV